ncbi:unnamed protein product, partial [marine sediment metagenome]
CGEEFMANNKEVEYNGFATPCLILEGSDKGNRGNIIDPYAKTEEQDGLLCGEWSRGLEDGLIHIYLWKPVAALCNEREEWAAKLTSLKEPIDYMPLPGAEVETSVSKRKPAPVPKRKVVLDPVTKQFKLI